MVVSFISHFLWNLNSTPRAHPLYSIDFVSDQTSLANFVMDYRAAADLPTFLYANFFFLIFFVFCF